MPVKWVADRTESFLTDAHGRDHHVDPVKALAKGAPQIHPEAEGNLIFDWELGDAKATDAAIKAGRACDADEDREQPPGAESRIEPRATLGHYDKARGPLHLLDDVAEPASGAAGDERLLQCRAGKQAARHRADVGGGFGSKIYIYPEEIVCLWASKKTGVPVKWVATAPKAS